METTIQIANDFQDYLKDGWLKELLPIETVLKY